MKPLLRAAGMLALMALCACSEERHRLDRHLAQLRPGAVAALPDMGWPAGTLLCPLALYQSELAGPAPPADRVNAFLKQQQFRGDESWSLIVVKPQPAGNAAARIEQLFFKRAEYDVINDPQGIARDAETAVKGFAPHACVSVEQARVLAIRPQGSHRTLIIFGTA
ncbi:hypothetical protein GQ37_000785 [Janthinobacterium sp. BJB1]|nr:hypothetical protein CSQ90_27785 [Janthinobacterium sp. BJB303]PJD00200.1 hypothetical protein GQ37_000785 [Janthinobacterium sp. BJB1]